MDGKEESKKEEEPKFKAFTGKGVSLNDTEEANKGADASSELYKTLAE